MEIRVSDVYCPICGAPEVDSETGKLLVRGFKVHNHDMWWSQCISGRDHGTTLTQRLDGTTVDVPWPAEPWFAFHDDENAFSVELPVDGKNTTVVCYYEYEEN
jgi:hypothetical protein